MQIWVSLGFQLGMRRLASRNTKLSAAHSMSCPQVVTHSRSAGTVLGLRPGQSQSGDSDPQCGITKTGNRYLRSLLIQSGHYILGCFDQNRRLGTGVYDLPPVESSVARSALW